MIVVGFTASIPGIKAGGVGALPVLSVIVTIMLWCYNNLFVLNPEMDFAQCKYLQYTRQVLVS